MKGACGDAARGAFIDFSNRFEGATPGEPERVWNTARPDGRLTLGTVYHLLGSGEPELTEDGVALAFTTRFGTELRYDHEAARWYAWTGDRWRADTKQLAFSWCRVTARELSEDLDPKVRNTVRKRAFASGVEAFARADPIHAVNQDCWDSDPWLLGCPGGMVELKTGKRRKADPKHGITKHTAIAPSQDACPTWTRFLSEATKGDDDMVEFLKRWCGYCLTGDTREHALIFLYGPGGNGKSVFLDTIDRIMGDYATTAAMGTFASSRGDKHRPSWRC